MIPVVDVSALVVSAGLERLKNLIALSKIRKPLRGGVGQTGSSFSDNQSPLTSLSPTQSGLPIRNIQSHGGVETDSPFHP
jgi:hypothetical protein